MADTSGSTAASAITSDAFRRLLIGARPRRTLLRAGVLVIVAYLVFGHALLPVRGEGPSMHPTVRDGQLVLVNTLAHWQAAPARGDIVALSLAGRRVTYIKRIVAMPGDRVRIVAGTLYVNDDALDEPYVERRNRWNVQELELEGDEYLLIGDNRSMPMRQHDFGKARRSRIVGRVVLW